MRWLCGALILMAGCTAGRRHGSPGGPQEAARRLAAAEHGADPSRAGWLRYLVASDPAGAEKLLAASRDPLALDALGEIREDRLDSEGAARAWADALAAAPKTPLAELAAIRLLDAQGDSRAVDDLVVKAAEGLRAGTAPRAARIVREAAARVFGSRGDAEQERAMWAQAGALQHWRVGGPYAALRLFDLSRTLALDGATTARAAPRFERELDFPDGDVGLELEPPEGDLFYAATDATLARGGDYLLWVEGAGAVELRIDGEVKLSRVPYPRESVRSQTGLVRLGAGPHRILARWSRVEGARFRLLLARGDGASSDLTTAAPAFLSGERKPDAPCALGAACVAPPAWTDESDLRAYALRLLDRDDGDPLGAWLLARVALGDDRPVARAAAERAVTLSGGGAPALALRAQQLLHDPEIPDRIGKARALADLVEVVARDPRFVRARLTAAGLERDAERFDDAAADLDKAEAALTATPTTATPTPTPTPTTANPTPTTANPTPTTANPTERPLPAQLLLARARLLEARGNVAAAKALAGRARGGGRCDALALLYDLSRREGGAAEQARLADGLVTCPEGLSTRATLARDRGDLSRAEELFARYAALRPAIPARLLSLAEVQVSRKQADPALASLRRAAELSPRSAEPQRRLAGALESLGQPDAARAAREAALELSPGDLQLRQQLALDRHRPLMPWSDRDGLALARVASKEKAPPGASAVRLLDYGAVQLFADGGGVEHIHTVALVLDKKGIGRFGEAQIPPDAQVLHLRTIKPDGRILEPESIPEKEGISLPGLEAGDAVEIDYLRPVAPRGPELPGYTLSSFLFRDDETPMRESSYEVRAPAALGLLADQHNLREREPQRVDGELRWSHSARDVAPLLPEPHQPPENEAMPWVQIGAGASQHDLVLSIADWALLRGRPATSTEALAQANQGRSPRETAEKMYAAIAEAVRGRSQGTDFSSPAGHVLAQGRGNRLLVLKATLAAAGIASHVVLVRTWGSDPADYRFPRGELYGYAVLRIELPGGAVWVDPSTRLAPFGQLPEYVRGQDAWVLPEPGEAPVRLRVPAELPGQREGRAISLELLLSKDGSATGTGRDEHDGYGAAGLKDALERMDQAQRKQAVEAMLGRGLHGVTLDSLAADHESQVGGPAALVFALHTQLARQDGSALFAPASVLPERLGRRWAQKAERAQPLLIDASEKSSTRARIALPPGLHLKAPPAPLTLDTPFGSYRWSAREEKGKLVLEESLSVPLQRIPPERYKEFVAFVAAVDDAQTQELRLAP